MTGYFKIFNFHSRMENDTVLFYVLVRKNTRWVFFAKVWSSTLKIFHLVERIRHLEARFQRWVVNSAFSCNIITGVRKAKNIVTKSAPFMWRNKVWFSFCFVIHCFYVSLTSASLHPDKTTHISASLAKESRLKTLYGPDKKFRKGKQDLKDQLLEQWLILEKNYF